MLDVTVEHARQYGSPVFVPSCNVEKHNHANISKNYHFVTSEDIVGLKYNFRAYKNKDSNWKVAQLKKTRFPTIFREIKTWIMAEL